AEAGSAMPATAAHTVAAASIAQRIAKGHFPAKDHHRPTPLGQGLPVGQRPPVARGLPVAQGPPGEPAWYTLEALLLMPGPAVSATAGPPCRARHPPRGPPACFLPFLHRSGGIPTSSRE